jgi:hypothetical protein
MLTNLLKPLTTGQKITPEVFDAVITRGQRVEARLGDRDTDTLGESAMASVPWGRKETIIFPPHSPIYTYRAVIFAAVAHC